MSGPGEHRQPARVSVFALAAALAVLQMAGPFAARAGGWELPPAVVEVFYDPFPLPAAGEPPRPVRRLFALLDQDRDGFLGRVELGRLCAESHAVPLDLDGDGRVSAPEYWVSFQTVPAIDPLHARPLELAQLVRARELAKSGDWRRALLLLREVGGRCRLALAQAATALAARAVGLEEEARSLCSEAIEADPLQPLPWLLRAELRHFGRKPAATVLELDCLLQRLETMLEVPGEVRDPRVRARRVRSFAQKVLRDFGTLLSSPAHGARRARWRKLAVPSEPPSAAAPGGTFSAHILQSLLLQGSGEEALRVLDGRALRPAEAGLEGWLRPWALASVGRYSEALRFVEAGGLPPVREVDRLCLELCLELGLGRPEAGLRILGRLAQLRPDARVQTNVLWILARENAWRLLDSWLQTYSQPDQPDLPYFVLGTALRLEAARRRPALWHLVGDLVLPGTDEAFLLPAWTALLERNAFLEKAREARQLQTLATPLSPAAWSGLAAAWVQVGEDQAAAEALSTGLTLCPAAAEGWDRLAFDWVRLAVPRELVALIEERLPYSTTE